MNPRWLIVLSAFVLAITAAFPPGVRNSIELLAIAGAVYAVLLMMQAAREAEAKDRAGRKIGAVRRGIRILSYALFPVRFGERDAANCVKEVAGDMKVTADALGKMVHRPKRNFRHENFETAMQREAPTKEEIAQREHAWHRNALISTFVTMMFAAIAIGGFGCATLAALGFGFHMRMAVMIGFSGVSGMAMFYCLALTQYFRLDQIRHQQFYPFVEFVFRRGGWLQPLWIA